ncbi:MAG TPA: RagB/SusD family nutrient uptake outer membrane protein, partial [Panacibacter sp.]|nr:RagB/SusD family nutrient uptake outer membrane protein [Panacibacter sp.]
MKKMKIKFIGFVSGTAALILLLVACSKSFLEKTPIGTLNPETLANSAGVQGLLIGAYSALDGFGVAGAGWQAAASNWVYGGVTSEDAYKGSDNGDQPDINPIETYSPTASNGYFNQKWQAVYDGVQRCNDVLKTMRLAKDISPADTQNISGQARFLRAHFHFEAKKMWKNVPFVNEDISYANGNYNVTNTADIWPDIENDL